MFVKEDLKYQRRRRDSGRSRKS